MVLLMNILNAKKSFQSFTVFLKCFKIKTSKIYHHKNSINFGRLSKEESVDCVILPPWASDAEDFVRKNREALESEYVSKNLHVWIDLIFGYKQRGQEAKNSGNIYPPLTYDDCLDLNKVFLTDKESYEKAVDIINNFGQCPAVVKTLLF